MEGDTPAPKTFFTALHWEPSILHFMIDNPTLFSCDVPRDVTEKIGVSETLRQFVGMPNTALADTRYVRSMIPVPKKAKEDLFTSSRQR